MFAYFTIKAVFTYKQGQTVHRTEVIDKLDRQKTKLKIRQTNSYTEERADRKLILQYYTITIL